MISKLRAVALALVAVTAIGAVSASAAQAGEFTAERYPATVTGVQTAGHTFKFMMGTVTCKSATFHGELGAAATELTLKAGYGECKTGAGNAVTVNMTTCDYRFHAGETLAMDEVDGSLDVSCAEVGDTIDFSVPASGCKVQIPAQNGLATLTYTDNTVEQDFDVDIAVSGLTYKQGPNCGGGEGVFNTGEYTGKSTITGEKEGMEDGLIVH
jgi:uncharacterized protein YaiE (UPF0345 family)